MSELNSGELVNFTDIFIDTDKGDEGDEKKHGLFHIEDGMYKLSGDYDEIKGGSIFKEEFDLNDAMKKGGSDTDFINFNQIKEMETLSFKNLKSTNADLEFYFESDEAIRLAPFTFGANFTSLKAIKGNNKKVQLVLCSNTFENENVLQNIEDIKDVRRLYLYGEWDKGTFKKLAGAIKDDGKIYEDKDAEEKFSLDGKFEKSDFGEDLLTKLSKDMISNVIQGTISEDEKNAIKSKRKEKVKAIKAENGEADGKKTEEQGKEQGFFSWNDIVKDHGAVCGAMFKFVLGQMKEKGISIKATLIAEKVGLDESGEPILSPDCFEDIKLIGAGVVIKILKMLSEKWEEGASTIKLKNDKNNRDKFRIALKEHIKSNWAESTKGIKTNLVMIGKVNNEIANKLGATSKEVIENVEDANKYMSDVLQGADILDKGCKFERSQVETMIDCLKQIGKSYKEAKNKEKTKDCIICIERLKSALKGSE